MEQVAHMRYLQATNQCDLVLPLNVSFQGITMNEEMHAVRRVTDTIGSLIEHIKNKLVKIINDKLSELNRAREPSYDIQISFKRRKNRCMKHIPPDTVLETFMAENQDKTRITIFQQEFTLVINPPIIKSMHLPSVLYATYCIQPLRFFGLYTERVASKFTWFKSKDKIEWEEVGVGFDYLIREEDIDHFLKVVCLPISLNNIVGPQAEAVSKRKVQKFPELPNCPFQQRHEFTKDSLADRDFRFVTYNTLSNRYTEMNEAFSYCPLEALAIDYRKQLILKELLGYNADIMCLQEVDNREYTSYFNIKLSEQGYTSKFHRKGNNLPEGLMCSFKKSRYKLLSYQQLVLANALRTKKLFEPLYNIIKRNKDLKDSFMRQSTSLQIIQLRCKELKKIIVIGNTHLYYHPKATAIRLLQAYMSTEYLFHVKERALAEWKNTDVDIIFCGDLNSGPAGSVYSFLSNGVIPPDDESCLQISGKNPVTFKHELNFVSACGTPKYTNYTNDFRDCLDYIFIQKDKIEVKQIVPLPEEDLEQYVGLPNECYPSDHIALVVDLHFK